MGEDRHNDGLCVSFAGVFMSVYLSSVQLQLQCLPTVTASCFTVLDLNFYESNGFMKFYSAWFSPKQFLFLRL